MTDQINPYQAPGSEIVPEVTGDPLLPSRWKRLGAAALDMAIGIVCAIPLFLYQSYVLGIPWVRSFRSSMKSSDSFIPPPHFSR
jgi:hypothetical protein